MRSWKGELIQRQKQCSWQWRCSETTFKSYFLLGFFLRASVVCFSSKRNHHGDTEGTERKVREGGDQWAAAPNAATSCFWLPICRIRRPKFSPTFTASPMAMVLLL